MKECEGSWLSDGTDGASWCYCKYNSTASDGLVLFRLLLVCTLLYYSSGGLGAVGSRQTFNLSLLKLKFVRSPGVQTALIGHLGVTASLTLQYLK